MFIGITIIIIDHIWHLKNPSIDDFSSVYFYFEYALFLRIISIIVFFICYILSFILGTAFAIILSYIIPKFRPLSWFGNSTLAIFLYGVPCLIGIILCEALWTFLRRNLLSKYPKKNPMEINTIKHIERLCFNFERHWALLLVFVLLMSLSIYMGYRSLYFILLWSIFICPIYLSLILFEFIIRWLKKKFVILFNEQGWYWLFAPYIVSLIPLIHTLEMTSRLLRLAIPIMGRRFHSSVTPQDVIICLLIVIPAALFFLIFIPNIQRLMNYTRVLILLTISFLIIFLIACLRQPFTPTHPKIIQALHQSTTTYKLTRPQISPMILPINSRKSLITIESFDNLILSPTLDEISTKTGHVLHNRQCSKPTKCSFDDNFNRTLPFHQIELTSMDDINHYKFTIRHISSYQVKIDSSLWPEEIFVHNSRKKPRTETIIDIDTNDRRSSFSLTITIEHCDLNDSPFLLLMRKYLPHIVFWGEGSCRTFTDILFLTVDKF